MSRRDLLYSIGGHLIFVLAFLLLTPISGGLLGDRLPPLIMPIMPVGLVKDVPAGGQVIEQEKPKVDIPEPAADDAETIEPLQKDKKEELTRDKQADSLKARQEKLAKAAADSARAEKARRDSLAALALADSLKNAGELTHTITNGVGGGTDDIFGESVPAVGYGATDPYWQSLFFGIQRAFRNPVPGYKTVRCVVTFTVMNTGEIKDIKLETSSGVPRFDRAAIRAIERVDWGKPFPDKFEGYDGYHIRMPFEYSPQ